MYFLSKHINLLLIVFVLAVSQSALKTVYADDVTLRQIDHMNRFYNSFSQRVFNGNADANNVASQTFGVAYTAFALNKSQTEIDQANDALDIYLTGKQNFWDGQTADPATIDPYWDLPVLASLISDPALNQYLTADNEAKAKALLVNFTEWDHYDDRPSLYAPYRHQIHGSDNHDMHTRSVHWTTAQLIKDDPAYANYVSPDGYTAEQLYGKWTNNLLDYFQTRAGQGQSVEFGSSVYQPTYMKPIFHIAQHAEDSRLKQISRNYIDLHIADAAQETIEGIRGGAKVRVPKNRSLNATNERSIQYLWMFTGAPEEGFNGVVPEGMHLVRMLGGAATTDYRPPDPLIDFINDDVARGSYTYTSNRPGEGVRINDGGLVYSEPTGDQSSILRSTRVTPDYALGWFTIDENKTYMNIHTQNQWMGAVTDASPNSRIVVNLTANDSQYSELQAVGHDDAVLIRKQNDGPSSQDPRVYVSNDFTYTTEADGWVFGDDGAGSFFAMKGILPSGNSIFVIEDPSSEGGNGDYLRFTDDKTVVVLQMGRSEDYVNIDAFKTDIRDNPLTYSNGAVTYDGTGSPIKLFDNRTVPQVDGQTLDLTPAKVYDSPYLNADYGSKVVTFTDTHFRDHIIDFNYNPIAPTQSMSIPSNTILSNEVFSPGYRELVGVTELSSDTSSPLTYTIDSTGILQIDFDAYHDVMDTLIVNGDLQLGGELSINLVRDFPSTSGTYQIFQADSISGMFDTLSLPETTNGLTWNTDNLYTNGTISLVQNPFILFGDTNTNYSASNPDDNPPVDPNFAAEIGAISPNFTLLGLDEGGNNNARVMTFSFDPIEPNQIDSVKIEARINGLGGYTNDNLVIDSLDNLHKISTLQGYTDQGGWMNLIYELDPSEFALLSDGQLSLAFYDDIQVDWVELSWVEAPVLAGIPGDFNNDSIVDLADYTVWRDNYGAGDESSLNGNGSGSGGVDMADYNLWIANFGNSTNSSSEANAIPEPTANSLLIIGTLLSAFRKRA